MNDAGTTENERPAGPSRSSYDVAIVGAGIVGMAAARELVVRRPGLRVVVLEKDRRIASQQSGHNSGVIHSGIYYTPGSLKARACVAGHREMMDFCKEHGIRYERCGKLIVALSESELPRLDELYCRGTANGVQGLEMVGPEQMREIEPYAAGIRAVYSPNTGIVDYVQVAQAYAQAVREREGEIVTGCEVAALAEREGSAVLRLRRRSDKREVDGEVEARHVILCAGLQSDLLTPNGKRSSSVRIVPFRGDYYVLSPAKRHMVRALIYPVPDPRFPFLGVHFTRRIDGEVWAGPNAVLAFAREGYGRWQIRPGDLLDSLSYPGFWRMAARYWRTGLAEMYRDYVKRAYVREMARYIPALGPEDVLPGPSGVRAQALGTDGRLVDDFLIQRSGRAIQVLNAPSPAATSSLVIGRMIVDEAEQTFDLASAERRAV